jgi:hypothetical protein
MRAVALPTTPASSRILHALIGLERLAVHDPDGRQQTQQFRVAGLRRLQLDQLVDWVTAVARLSWPN